MKCCRTRKNCLPTRCLSSRGVGCLPSRYLSQKGECEAKDAVMASLCWLGLIRSTLTLHFSVREASSDTGPRVIRADCP
jgi:hypothetical protein